MLNLHKPLLTKIEIKEVQTILKSSWISYAGKNVEIFEDEFAKFVGSKHAISCINGTSALHLSLLSSNIKKKTENCQKCREIYKLFLRKSLEMGRQKLI